MSEERMRAEFMCERAGRVREMAGDLPSPCMNVCRMDEQRVHCLGCLRTIDEIRAWRELDDEGKRIVWAAVEQRARLRLAAAGTSFEERPA